MSVLADVVCGRHAHYVIWRKL